MVVFHKDKYVIYVSCVKIGFVLTLFFNWVFSLLVIKQFAKRSANGLPVATPSTCLKTFTLCKNILCEHNCKTFRKIVFLIFVPLKIEFEFNYKLLLEFFCHLF